MKDRSSIWAVLGAAFLYALMLAGLISLSMSKPAKGHDIYYNWINGNGVGCCDGKDCAPLTEDRERIAFGRLQVRVEGQWCSVLSHHYLKRGNAPDHSTSHICVRVGQGNPCERLLCYQPKPLF